MNLAAIEPLESLGIELLQCNTEQSEFRIPLVKNRNDKGTLFAGSQYSALVLAGWYLASYWAESQGLSDKVAIKDCQVSYPKAALSDLSVRASFRESPQKRPSGHWRALIDVVARDSEGEVVSTLSGDYRILYAATDRTAGVAQ